MKLTARIFCLLGLAILLVIMPDICIASEKETIIIGGDFNYPPYEYLDSKQVPKGYNVELSRLIGDILSADVQFNLSKWSQAIKLLDTGEVDVLQGMALSSERARTYYFSQPHTQTWRSVFVFKGSGITGLDDLTKARILIQQGDIAKDYLKLIDFAGTTVEVPTQEDALFLLNTGKYDAAIVNHMYGMYFSKHNSLNKIDVLTERILTRDYCYASQDKELISRINGALKTLIQNRKLIDLQAKWFSEYEPRKDLHGLFDARHWRWLIPISLLIISMLVVLVTLQIRLRRRSKLLEHELSRRCDVETELRREHSLFTNGPVVLYHLKAEPPELLYISPNISQWGFTSEDVEVIKDMIVSVFKSGEQDLQTNQMDENGNLIENATARQYRLVTKTGEHRWVFDYSLSHTGSDGYCIHYGYLLDITPRIELEEALQDAKIKAEAGSTAKGHFLASMSHEIRTPLNGIIGLIDILRDMHATEQQAEIIDMLHKSGRSLYRIVSDVLDLSKIESGKMELLISPFNLRFLVEDMVRGFAFHRDKSNLDIRSSISDDLPDTVMGDMARLRQILLNLMQNAVKFTHEGWVELAVEVYSRTADEARILFTVGDTGIGIDKAKFKDIFDNFGQADNMIFSQYGGTGLGLSIVKRLVEMMNGFIWVESEPGKGSYFYFIIPFRLREDTGEAINASDQQIPSQFEAFPSHKVLVVEDDLISQKVLRHQLEKWGLTVVLAANGEKALEVYKTENPEFILMDLQMPVMDGIEATQRIRSMERGTDNHIPISAVTAAVLAADRQRCLDSGMDHYVTKPIDLGILYSTIKQIIANLDGRKP
jgi:signal transduction histidine kinase/CheY-like chemotaxis protein/ABC-type amino acid transport substrate-binding protein